LKNNYQEEGVEYRSSHKPFIEVYTNHFVIYENEKFELFYKDIANIYFKSGKRNVLKVFWAFILYALGSYVGEVELEYRCLYVVFKDNTKPVQRYKVPISNFEIKEIVRIIKSHIENDNPPAV
jgi:hypothetical protein